MRYGRPGDDGWVPAMHARTNPWISVAVRSAIDEDPGSFGMTGHSEPHVVVISPVGVVTCETLLALELNTIICFPKRSRD